jgi:heme-degrading monooxygenase HmoA
MATSTLGHLTKVDKMSTKQVARVAKSKIHAEKIEEGRILWEQQVIPAMKAAPGFRHVYVLGDDKTGAVMTISLWDTEAHADDWEKCETQCALRNRLAGYVASVPTPETYHVKIEA